MTWIQNIPCEKCGKQFNREPLVPGETWKGEKEHFKYNSMNNYCICAYEKKEATP